MRMQAVKCFVRTIVSIREDTFAKSGEKVLLFLMLFLFGAPRLRFPGHLPPKRPEKCRQDGTFPLMCSNQVARSYLPGAQIIKLHQNGKT